jgi:hypothetical protein
MMREAALLWLWRGMAGLPVLVDWGKKRVAQGGTRECEGVAGAVETLCVKWLGRGK